MSQFEYKTFVIRETIERGATPDWTAIRQKPDEILAALGADGWELATSITAQPAPRIVETRYVFKRAIMVFEPLPDEAMPPSTMRDAALAAKPAPAKTPAKKGKP